jgi:hypothetical protein
VGGNCAAFFSSQWASVLRLIPNTRQTPRSEARSWQAAKTCCLNASG